MDEADCWSELGIAPTDDLAAIRRAYARKLKTIDVQTDPRAFIALRAAYEAARDGKTSIASLRWGFDAREDATALPEGEWLVEMDAIEALLRGKAARDAIFGPITDHTKRLVACARTSSIDQSAMIEDWIAEAIVNGAPRSNGMLLPAINGFGWDARADGYDCPVSIDIALARYDDLHYLYSLCKVNPHYRLAWTALTEGVADVGEIHAESMNALLGIVQYQRPGLRDDIDPDHFQRWIDDLEERRAETRREAARGSEPPPPPSWVREAIAGFGLILIGAAIDIAAWMAFVDEKLGMLRFGIVAVVGVIVIAFGMENRAAQKRLRRAYEEYHARQ